MMSATTIATIQAAFINPPQPGKRNFSIKDANGHFWSVPPNLGSTLVAGTTYEIQYRDNNFNGKVFHMVESAKPVIPAVQPPPQHQHYAQPAPQQVPQPTGQYHQPKPFDPTPERIYVCGAVNSAIHAGQVNVMNVSDLVQATRNAREAWRITLGNPQQNADLDDEIPM